MISQKPFISKSKWSHILYLNKLSDISFISDIKHGIVSADMCRGKSLENLDILKYIDFLFISDEDVFMDLKELSGLVKQGVMLHHKGGSIFYNKNGTQFSTEVDVLDNINVLGCGDMLASCFINQYLNCDNIEKSVRESHDLVSNYLRRTK